MHESKRRRLEANGWRVAGAREFLALSDQEAAYIELKLKLAECLRKKRRERRLGQTDLAKLVKSSQSRVAKMESADRSVSIDLLIRSLLALGTSQPELGRILASPRAAEHKKTETAYDRLKPWIGNVRTGGRHDSRNAGDQMADELERGNARLRRVC